MRRKNQGALTIDKKLSAQGPRAALLYRDGNPKGLSAEMMPKIARILARLDVATQPEQMSLPGWSLHPLKGRLKGFWSVWVTGNWRIVFRFEGSDVVDVDLVDYH